MTEHEEPDWSQIDATQEQVQEWMRARAANANPTQLAWDAFQHFHRPFHMHRLYQWASEIIIGASDD